MISLAKPLLAIPIQTKFLLKGAKSSEQDIVIYSYTKKKKKDLKKKLH